MLLLSLPFNFLWWLNRHGTTLGRAVHLLLCDGYYWESPSDYAGQYTPIPLILIFPIIIATIFIRPRAGLWALLLEMSLLGIQLARSDVPQAYAVRFMLVGTLNLAGVTVILMVGSAILARALRSSVAANQALQPQRRARRARGRAHRRSPGGQGGRRAGQSAKSALPGQYEPRAAHPAQRHPWAMPRSSSAGRRSPTSTAA